MIMESGNDSSDRTFGKSPQYFLLLSCVSFFKVLSLKKIYRKAEGYRQLRSDRHPCFALSRPVTPGQVAQEAA